MPAFSQIAKSKPSSSSSFNARKGEDFFGVQAKLNIGKSNDKYEAEADKVADNLVSDKKNTAPLSLQLLRLFKIKAPQKESLPLFSQS